MKTPKTAILPTEIFVRCVDNSGEAFGRSIGDVLNKGELYKLKNLANSGMYVGEVVAELYDKNNQKIQISPDVNFWRLDEKFQPCLRICLN